MTQFVAAEEPRPGTSDRLAEDRGRRTLRRIRRIEPLRLLARFERYLDGSATSSRSGAIRLRRALALLFGGYAAIVEVKYLQSGSFSPAPIVMVLLALALFIGRGGRFLHYFVPVFLGVYAYGLAGRFAGHLKLAVHYTPQIEFDKWLPGPMPTVWLQAHLYHGRTGAVEIFAVAMYISHFFVPLFLAFGLAMAHRGRAFARLMFGLLIVSILGEITFVLAPTAPPWLAAQDGFLPGVHHLLKSSFYDLRLPKLGSLVGDPKNYDITAAVPSLHVAFPVLGFLTVRRYGLPKWVAGALLANIAGVVFAIVYLGEHYVADAAAGAVYAVIAWVLVGRLLGEESLDLDARPEPDLAVVRVPAPLVSAESGSIARR